MVGGGRRLGRAGMSEYGCLVTLLVMAAVLVIREAWHRDAEARIIAAGGAIMIVVQAAELARNVVPVHLPFDFSIAAFGFGAVLHVAVQRALARIEVDRRDPRALIGQRNSDMDCGGGLAGPPLLVGEDNAMRGGMRRHVLF